MKPTRSSRPLEIHPVWLTLVFIGSVGLILVAAAGWTWEWRWPDEFWRPVLVQAGVGGLLAAGGYVGFNLLRREAAIQREETVAAVRAEVSRLQPVPAARVGSSDTTAPQLRRFEIAPRSVNISEGPAAITLTAELVDDVAGLAGDGYTSAPTQVRFRSASGQELTGVFQPHKLVEGDQWAGVYEEHIEVPMHSEGGEWVVAYFLLVDQVGNRRTLTAQDLVSLGFPASFTVDS